MLLSESISNQRICLERHLGALVPAFTDKDIEHTRTNFHRQLTVELRIYAAEDMKTLLNLADLQPEPTEAAG